MAETFRVLNDYKKLVIENGGDVRKTVVTATEASRVAENAQFFFKKIEREIGFKIQIITSEGEAYYTSFGVSKSAEDSRDFAVIMDIGGASTELIKVNLKKFEVYKSISLPVGAVRATEWIAANIYSEKIQKVFEAYPMEDFITDNLISVAGTMTSLGAMLKKLKEYDDKMVQGTKIDLGRFEHFVKEISNVKESILAERFPFLGKRVKTIIGGACVAYDFARRLAVKSLEVSTYGLRYGTLFSGEIDEKFIVIK
jgi:exopolyphosphatase/guanosine-5'-triphosphate,3'-diphosphate pyrophosphatase